MTQSVWQVTDIARFAETLCIVNHDPRFQAGVLALAHGLGIDPAPIMARAGINARDVRTLTVIDGGGAV